MHDSHELLLKDNRGLKYQTEEFPRLTFTADMELVPRCTLDSTRVARKSKLDDYCTTCVL